MFNICRSCFFIVTVKILFNALENFSNVFITVALAQMCLRSCMVCSRWLMQTEWPTNRLVVSTFLSLIVCFLCLIANDFP